MRYLGLTFLLTAFILLACGGDGDGDNTGAQASPSVAASPAATAALTSTPRATTTGTPAAAITGTPASTTLSADDPTGDCIANAGPAIACLPSALDIRRLTVERTAAGDVLVTVEISPPGWTSLNNYFITVGFDTDRNAATGNTMAYPVSHGMAPDLELAYIVTGGSVQAGALNHRSFPTPIPVAAGLVEWRQLDANRLQATVRAAALNNATSFWVVTDLNVADRYDHVPDNGRFAYPEGRVLPR